MHSATTGLVDLVVDTDEEALDAVRRFLSYMPSHNRVMATQTNSVDGDSERGDEIVTLVPADRRQVYDVRKVIKAIVDQESFFPLKERFGKVVVTGFARLDGRTIGVIATNPVQGRRHRYRRLRQDRGLHSVVRQYQHFHRPAGRHAWLSGRLPERAARSGRRSEEHTSELQ